MKSYVNEICEFTDLDHLSASKLHQLDTVLKSILALSITRDTYVSIIDGKLPSSTPGLSNQSTGSHKAREQYEEFRKAFTAQVLKLDTQLVYKYQIAPLGSCDHNLRLLEITAASVHTVAGTIYSFFHPDTEIKPLRSLGEPSHTYHDAGQFYVDFYHCYFVNFENYPFGLLNVIGYWAETQVLGGVLLFDRGDSGSENNNVFVQPNFSGRAFQLSSQQIAQFSALNKSAAHLPGAETLLPFSQEPGAHTEKVWVARGEPPLRIYKTEYDKHPTSTLRVSCCVIHTTSHGPSAVVNAHSSLSSRRSDKDGASK